MQRHWRPSAVLAFFLASTAAVFGVTFATPSSASAAAGDPFDPLTSQVFVAQGNPSTLYRAVTDGTGTTTFVAQGPASNFQYNAIGYWSGDNYIYGLAAGPGTTSSGQAVVAGDLIRVGQGGYTTLAKTGVFPTQSATGTVCGNTYYATIGSSPTNLYAYNLLTGTLTVTAISSANPAGGADFSCVGGYLWGGTNFGQMYRIDPATGTRTFFSAPFLETGNQGFGAAWTYGNGNLGLSDNTTGTVYQVKITNPGSASPTFTLISMNGGPASSANDGTSIPGSPTDLAITKTGPVSFLPGNSISYTLKVTNNGAGTSSGFVLSDTVPAPLTVLSTSSSGCSISANTVTCVSGTLTAGSSQTFTITVSTTAAMTTCVTNTASVLANETDPVSSNNTSSATSCPAAVSLVKTASVPNYGAAGQTVTYTFTGTNTGAATLHNVQIAEGTFTGSGTMSALTCNPALGGTLAPSASMVCTATYTTTQADVNTGSLANTATITGLDPVNETVTANSSVTIPVTQSVQVDKTWIIKNAAGTVVGTYNIPAQPTDTGPIPPTGFSTAPTLTGQTGAVFGTTYSGYLTGQSVTVGEGTVSVPSGCTVATQKMTAVNGATLTTAAALPYTATLAPTPRPNTFTITNTVTCTQTLTLVKQVAFGSLPATAWTLTGTGPSGSLPGPNGATGSVGASVNVTPQVGYTLAETSTATGAQNYAPTAAGWVCQTGSGSVPVTGGAVTVGYGQNVTCTITNTTAKISVLKHIQDPADGLTAGQFNLTITPPIGLGGATTVTGSETVTAANTFEVRPGSTYTLTEQSLSSSTAYLALGLQQSTDGGSTWTAATGNQITPTAGTQVQYRLVNESVPAIALPLTGGVGTDVIAFWAIVLFALTAALLSWQLFRRSRRSAH